MKHSQYKEYSKLINIFFEGQWWNVFWMIFFYILKHSPVWVMPIVIARLIDLHSVEPNKRINMLILYGGLMILMFVIHPFLHPIYIKFQSKIARGVSLDLRIKLCRKLQQLSLLFHNRTRVGRLHSKIIRDIDVIESLPRLLTESFITAILTILITFVIILVRAPITILLFSILVPIAIAVRRKYRSVIKESAKLFRVNFENMSASLSDMMQMIPVTRAHGLEEYQMKTIIEKITNVFKKGMEYDIISAKYISISWAGFMICQTVFLIGAVYLSFLKVITVGDIVMFNSFFASVSGSILMLFGTLPMLTQVKESIESINEVLNYPDIEQNEGKIKISNVYGKFEFKNVYYSYPDSSEDAVSDITLKIEPGMSVGIVGPSGCGKTTLLFLLLGFIRPTKGKILIDDKDMNEIDLRSFRNYVSVVTQDTVFFSGTIKENVAYGETYITDEDVIRALKMANAWDFVKELPDNINTVIGEKGVSLSGGEKQRIAIARALIREPHVLILDEATSALDVISEKLIQDTLELVMKNQTTIIVSHRLSIVRNVDMIVVLDKGRIVAIGTHNELMKFDNPYSRFYIQSNINTTV